MPDIDRIICDPDFEQWSDIIRSNSRLSKKSSLLLSTDIDKLRASIISQSISYTQSIDSSFDPNYLMAKTSNSNSEIIMTGHQPIISHPGILVKNRFLDSYAARNRAFSINIIIDTDFGIGGKFCYPSKKSGSVNLDQLSISDVDNVFFNQHIGREYQIRQAFKKVRDGGLISNLDLLREVEEFYVSMAGRSVVDVNTLLRRKFCSLKNTLELPLTRLIEFSLVKIVFGKIISDFFHFHDVYNLNLKEYRRDRRIRSRVNPFPDLVSNDNGYELPFWIICKESGERFPLFVNNDENSLFFYYDKNKIKIDKHDLDNYSDYLPRDVILVPRAVLITMILRLFCSDLFVHGLGGAKYDQFTDRLISSYFKIIPPKYVKASADVYMFKDQISRYEDCRSKESKKREIIYNIKNYLSGNIFSQKEKEKLESLYTKKKQLVSSFKDNNDTKQKKELASELKVIDLSIKQLVDRSDYFSGLSMYFDVFSASRDAYYCRSYPFFLVKDEFDFLFRNNQ